jgi:pimeloyl-ACP methyl ester carboxylesterase
VLLIWGTRDRMVSHKGVERILEALPATEVELLEGVGHCLQPI